MKWFVRLAHKTPRGDTQKHPTESGVSTAASKLKCQRPRHTVWLWYPLLLHLNTRLLERALRVTDHYKKGFKALIFLYF